MKFPSRVICSTDLFFVTVYRFFFIVPGINTDPYKMYLCAITYGPGYNKKYPMVVLFKLLLMLPLQSTTF